MDAADAITTAMLAALRRDRAQPSVAVHRCPITAATCLQMRRSCRRRGPMVSAAVPLCWTVATEV